MDHPTALSHLPIQPFPAARPLLALLALLALPGAGAAAPAASPPESLADTGLYADLPSRTLAAEVVAYRPRYPLWTDGLEKERWIRLPPGAAIDASDPGSWDFPVGTKLWKQFSLDGKPVETRLLERAPGGWIFAAYAWDPDGLAATLVPAHGLRGVAELAPGVRHDIPGHFECASCHHGQDPPVLGFDAVQLATGRTEPGAPDLVELTQRGLLVGTPVHLLESSDASRPEPGPSAALGYLHGNCGHCHNSEGPLASLGLDLRLEADGTQLPGALRTAVARPASTSARAAAASLRIDPGAPERSQLLQRVATRDPFAQMPPLGTRLVDPEGLELLVGWIRDELTAPPDGSRSSTPNP